MSRVTKLQKRYKATRSGGARWRAGHRKQCRDSRRQGRAKYDVRYWHQTVGFLHQMTCHVEGIISRYYAQKKTESASP